MVADNQIRWSDLCMLKDDWEGEERRKRHRRTEANGPPSVEKGDDEADSAKSYRVREIYVDFRSHTHWLSGSRS